MKKLLAAIFVAALGVYPLFADDVADVKALLIKDLELGANGDFMGSLALRTPDCVEVSPENTLNYQQGKWISLALDGEHPVEFFLAALALGSHGEFKTPTEDLMAWIRAMTSDPDFLREYKAEAAKMLAAFKADQALQLKTLKIVGIEVDGDAATAHIELDANTPRGIRHYAGTISLRKVDGKWMYCKSVFEYR